MTRVAKDGTILIFIKTIFWIPACETKGSLIPLIVFFRYIMIIE